VGEVALTPAGEVLVEAIINTELDVDQPVHRPAPA
jgi:hypothetical protein